MNLLAPVTTFSGLIAVILLSYFVQSKKPSMFCIIYTTGSAHKTRVGFKPRCRVYALSVFHVESPPHSNCLKELFLKRPALTSIKLLEPLHNS